MGLVVSNGSLFGQRNDYRYCSTLRSGIDPHSTAQRLGMLTDGAQSNSRPAGFVVDKTVAVVRDSEQDAVQRRFQLQMEGPATRVSENVGNAFLRATIDRHFDRVRGLAGKGPNIENGLESRFDAALLH